MKLIEGNIDALPKQVHVEQDGSYFFILPHARVDCEYVAPFVVLDTGAYVSLYGPEGEAEQQKVRALLASKGINATFDY